MSFEPSPQQLRGIRYHEAGHAVVAHLIGGRVSGITCKDSTGKVNCRFSERGGQLVAVAGAIASVAANFDGKTTINATSELSADDGAMLADPLERIATEEGKTTSQILEYVSRITTGVVLDNWPAVEALEKALEATPDMDGETATAIIERVGLRFTPPVLAARSWTNRDTEAELEARKPLRDAMQKLRAAFQQTTAGTAGRRQKQR